MPKALVSVILPAYNAEAYIESSVRSVLAQTYRNFELIVVNDGSKDKTLEILTKLQSEDPRIRIVDQKNKGLIKTLNILLAECKGEYIARMDADDICHPNRFSAQIGYLRENPKVAVVGTGYRYIDQNSHVLGVRHTRSGKETVSASLVFGCPLAHPTVMINRALCESALIYDEAFPHAEDMAMWSNLVLGKKLAIDNLSEPLLDYRVHPNSVSSVHQKEQRSSAYKALRQHQFIREFERLGGDVEKVYNYDGFIGAASVIALLRANWVHPLAPSTTLLARSVVAMLSAVRRQLFGKKVNR